MLYKECKLTSCDRISVLERWIITKRSFAIIFEEIVCDSIDVRESDISIDWMSRRSRTCPEVDPLSCDHVHIRPVVRVDDR